MQSDLVGFAVSPNQRSAGTSAAGAFNDPREWIACHHV
jgi:hypothetical protein